jgi:hypothetical protein
MLTGGAEILYFDQWAIQTHQDPRGQGTYTSMTYSGRNKKQLTIICAYIAVPKGLETGQMSLYSQEKIFMEQQELI